jgi:hypothetical protein
VVNPNTPGASRNSNQRRMKIQMSSAHAKHTFQQREQINTFDCNWGDGIDLIFLKKIKSGEFAAVLAP